MVYVVRVGYVDFVFDNSEDAMIFANTAKHSMIDDKHVEITLYSASDWEAKNKKED